MQGVRFPSRYAKALLDLSVEQNQLEAVYADMQLVAASIGGSKDLELLLKSPVVNSDKKSAILKAVFTQLNKVTDGFIQLLVSKGRESFLADIAHSFIAQYKSMKGITVAYVKTAVALDGATRDKIIAQAKSLAGGSIEIDEVVEPELIGGFVLRVGDQLIDHSVSGKLKSLKREFSENLYVAEI
jgi:F-type H+-transporting ATPase subunit delta